MSQRSTPLAAIGPDRTRFLDPRRARLGSASPAFLAGAAVLISVGTASAGTSLVSRHSTLRATSGTVGGPGGNGFNDTQNYDGTDRFASEVGWGDDPSAGAMAHAHQYSTPGTLGASGAGLEGAFAEGEVRSAVTTGLGVAVATSGFEMHFTVDAVPISYTIGASIGTAGTGSAMVEMTPMNSDETIFTTQVASGEAGSKSLSKSGLLAPGDYLLHVEAASTGAPGGDLDNSAYFNFNLSFSAFTGVGGVTPSAVPLPPAVFGGGAVMGLLAGTRLIRRFRKAA